MEGKCIYWLEELRSSDNGIVGKKCANLGELMQGGFRVPPGFALSITAYNRFMMESGVKEEIAYYLRDYKLQPKDMAEALEFGRIAKDIRAIVEAKKMPPDMEADVRRYYRELCQKTNCPDLSVATRSAGPASHPGQYESYLHVRGEDDVVKNIVRVWSSTFNARSILARARQRLPLDYDHIGVAVLTMVDAKAAGVMFTLNPVNGDLSKIVIEGSWGLGEAVVSGSVTPDSFVVDKIVLAIEEKRIAAKLRQYAYNPQISAMEYQNTPHNLVTTQCLEDKEILELARIAKKMEGYFGCAQDVEWCVANDIPFPENIFLVQTRPESVWSKKKQAPLLGAKTGLELLFAQATTPIKVKF